MPCYSGDECRACGHDSHRVEVVKVEDTKRIEKLEAIYQELLMWFANRSNPEKLIPKISDEDMRDAKGFDKFSFKKEKQK